MVVRGGWCPCRSIAAAMVLAGCTDTTTGSEETLALTEVDKGSHFATVGNATAQGTTRPAPGSPSRSRYRTPRTEPVGEINAVCIATKPSSSEPQLSGTCTGTADVPDGQLALNVGGDEIGQDVTGAIVGGNGQSTKERPEPSVRSRLDLRRPTRSTSRCRRRWKPLGCGSSAPLRISRFLAESVSENRVLGALDDPEPDALDRALIVHRVRRASPRAFLYFPAPPTIESSLFSSCIRISPASWSRSPLFQVKVVSHWPIGGGRLAGAGEAAGVVPVVGHVSRGAEQVAAGWAARIVIDVKAVGRLNADVSNLFVDLGRWRASRGHRDQAHSSREQQ